MSTRVERIGDVVVRIRVSAAGWSVIESHRRESVADFEARDDALEYAISLARSQRLAVVEVYGRSGVLEARSQYAHGVGNVDQERVAGTETAR